MKEKAARDSFEAEVKRLESLNLTVLKKEMALLQFLLVEVKGHIFLGLTIPMT